MAVILDINYFVLSIVSDQYKVWVVNVITGKITNEF